MIVNPDRLLISFGISRQHGNAKLCKATCFYHSLEVEAFSDLSWHLGLEK